ncbi:MAG: hypothetical protein QM831_06750 [Kofleriaceae bacterium]
MRTNLVVLAILVASVGADAGGDKEKWSGEKTISDKDKKALVAFRAWAYPHNGWKDTDYPSNGIDEKDVRVLDSDAVIQGELVDERLKPTDDRSFRFWLERYCGVTTMPEVRIDMAVVKLWRFGATYPRHLQANPAEFMAGALPQCPQRLDLGDVPNAQKIAMAHWKKIKVLHYVLPADVDGKPWYIASPASNNLEMSFDEKTGELRIAYNQHAMNIGDQGERWWANH